MPRDEGGPVAVDSADPDVYFTYRPLSNLPTPPLSSQASASPPSACASLKDGDALEPSLRGPATHLVNLIPASASLVVASVPLVQTILAQASLPLETVALAVCILDSLNARFARSWRLSCPPFATAPSASKRHSLPSTLVQQLHIDSVRPELIVLAALVVAAKFTQDAQEPAQFYCTAWGAGLWSCRQLNATERCIVESLGYRIAPLYDEDCLALAMADMRLAGQQALSECAVPPTPTPPSPRAAGPSFVPAHGRSKTTILGPSRGLGLAGTSAEAPAVYLEASLWMAQRQADCFGQVPPPHSWQGDGEAYPTR